MAQILVRDIEEGVKERLQRRAVRHGSQHGSGSPRHSACRCDGRQDRSGAGNRDYLPVPRFWLQRGRGDFRAAGPWSARPVSLIILDTNVISALNAGRARRRGHGLARPSGAKLHLDHHDHSARDPVRPPRHAGRTPSGGASREFRPAGGRAPRAPRRSFRHCCGGRDRGAYGGAPATRRDAGPA